MIQLGRQVNVLRVVCDGPQMTFFVNDYQLETVIDGDLKSGSMGFIAEARDEPGIRVHFDDLTVWATE